MPAHSGRADAIVAYVSAHPGCLRADLLTALKLDAHNAMPTYCTRAGLIFPAGPRCSQRYYPTKDQARAVDADLRAQAERRRAQQKEDNHRRSNIKRRAARAAKGGRLLNTRPGACVTIAEGATISKDVRFIPAKPTRGRFEVLGAPCVVNAAESRPWAQAYVDSMSGA